MTNLKGSPAWSGLTNLYAGQSNIFVIKCFVELHLTYFQLPL